MEHFVEWMLLGVAERMPSGKRQLQPIEGQWVSYGRDKGMRGSDLRQRHYLCIEALARIGEYSIDHAAVLVAGKEFPYAAVGAASDRHANVIRVGYYEVKRRQHRPVPGSMDLLGIWLRLYLSWRNWVLYSPEATLQSELAEYRERYGQARARRLQAVTDSIRRDKDLIELACMYNRMGPFGRSLLERDIGSLRELAKKLSSLREFAKRQGYCFNCTEVSPSAACPLRESACPLREHLRTRFTLGDSLTWRNRKPA